MLTPDEVIKLLDLKPLPQEGGFFRETWRSSESIPARGLPDRYAGPRSFGTAIYYLLTPGVFSALHRLPGDEVFHFYLGDPVSMLQLHPGGRSEEVTLGPDITNGQQVQVIVPAGTWQGMHLKEGGRTQNTERNVAKPQQRVKRAAGTTANAELSGSSEFSVQGSLFCVHPVRFALLGTTIAPGYDPADYEAADPQRLIQDYPDRRDLILHLTQPR